MSTLANGPQMGHYSPRLHELTREIESDEALESRNGVLARRQITETIRRMKQQIFNLQNKVERQGIEINWLMSAKDRPSGSKPYSAKVAKLLNEVAQYFYTSVDLIRGDLRCHPVVQARHICMLLLSERMSGPAAGRVLGGKHHTSVIHGARHARKMIQEDSEVAALVERLRKLA